MILTFFVENIRQYEYNKIVSLLLGFIGEIYGVFIYIRSGKDKY